jgi:hypothetical protein
MALNEEKPEGGGFGGDVPDDLCYKWAEDYYRDSDAEIDKDKNDKFVPKTFYGGSSSKTKKKEPVKEKKPLKTANTFAAEPITLEQLTIGA